jgi:hypothetical protein
VKDNDELFQALQVRVSKLETQTRRWRALSASAVLAGVLLVLVGANRSETAAPTVIRARTVEARDFLLRDEHGRICARLTIHPTVERKAVHENPALQFFDENGEEVWVEPKGPTFEMLR